MRILALLKSLIQALIQDIRLGYGASARFLRFRDLIGPLAAVAAGVGHGSGRRSGRRDINATVSATAAVFSMTFRLGLILLAAASHLQLIFRQVSHRIDKALGIGKQT
jgi:hypothetical protein